LDSEANGLPGHVTLKIVAFSLVLSLGTAWLLRANWPQTSPVLASLSPLTFDDPLPTFDPSRGELFRREPLAVEVGVNRAKAPGGVLDFFRNRFADEPPPDLLRKAQSGDVLAQLTLAQLYERGGGGVRRDVAAARLWTQRAAGGGDGAAMHNLGLYLLEGQGGPRDLAAGQGVGADVPAAYRWFAVAAAGGDADARRRMTDLEGQLSPAERSALVQSAARYRPLAPSSMEGDPVIIAPASSTIETQQLLARKGYYVGPIDGSQSLSFLKAATAYLRDHPAAAQVINLPE